MTEVEITIREAIPSDAERLLATTRKIGQETDYLIMDEVGLALTEADLAYSLADLYESDTNILFVAFLDEELVGMASVQASDKYRVAHIGEVGICILKEYWGFGLGTELLYTVLDWAAENPVIRRLELTVQERNQRAVHLYEKVGFETEAIMKRGNRTDTGEFIDVRLMSLLINEV